MSQTRTEYPHGPSLPQLEEAGLPSQTFVFAPAAEIVRTPCFYADRIDTDLAPFGGLFLDPGFARYVAPPVTVSSLVHASALGNSGAVAWRGSIVNDSLQSLVPWVPETLIEATDGTQVRFKRPATIPGRKIGGHWLHIFSGSYANYAHWLSECMPKLHLFQWLRGQIADLGLLVPDHAPDSFIAQTLRLFEVRERDIVRLGANDVVTPEVLWYSPVFSLWGSPPMMAAAADDLATRSSAHGADAAVPPRRPYIRRATEQRRVANFDELLPVVTAFGFTVVDTGSMSLTEQIRTMRQADQVIGEHGAGMANMMFCRPGTRVLELFNPVGWQPAHWVLASACGLQYGFGIGAHAKTDAQPTANGNTDYTLTTAQIASALGAMLR